MLDGPRSGPTGPGSPGSIQSMCTKSARSRRPAVPADVPGNFSVRRGPTWALSFTLVYAGHKASLILNQSNRRSFGLPRPARAAMRPIYGVLNQSNRRAKVSINEILNQSKRRAMRPPRPARELEPAHPRPYQRKGSHVRTLEAMRCEGTGSRDYLGQVGYVELHVELSFTPVYAG